MPKSRESTLNYFLCPPGLPARSYALSGIMHMLPLSHVFIRVQEVASNLAKYSTMTTTVILLAGGVRFLAE